MMWQRRRRDRGCLRGLASWETPVASGWAVTVVVAQAPARMCSLRFVSRVVNVAPPSWRMLRYRIEA